MIVDGGSQPDADALQRRVDDAAHASRSDPHTARTDLERWIAAADHAGFDAVSAAARYALARVLVSLGAAETALLLIEEAARRWRAIGEIDEAIRTNLGRMHVLDDLGRHTDALTVGRATLDELGRSCAASDDIVWLRAAVEENVGVASGYLGRHAEALDAYAAAARCYDDLGLTADAARATANRGVELTELARPTEAIDALERAHRQFVAVGDRLWQALCQTNLSAAWTAAGRYLEAFRCLDAAEAALDGLEPTTEWMRAVLARATCLESLHLDVEALDLYDSLTGPLSEAGLLDDLGLVHLGRGTIYARRAASIDAARDAFRSATSAFESTGNDPMLARTCLASAPLDDEPLVLVQRAIGLLDGGDKPAELAAAHLAAARHLESVDTALAEAALGRAAVLIEPLGVPALRWQVHHRAGRLRRLAGRSDEAIAELHAAIAELDSIRATVHRDGIRQRFDGARGEAADDLVEILLATGDEVAAFALTDSIRGRGLADRLVSDERIDVGAPPDELLSVYDRLLTARGRLVGELAARARQLERRVISGTDVGRRAMLDPPTLPANCVVYQTIGDEITSFVAGDGGEVVAVRKLGEVSEIEALLFGLDAQWRRFAHREVVARHSAQLEGATVDVLRQLHDLLLAPLDEFLSPKLPLTIVPDGALGGVPFGALHDGIGYVLERHATRQTPSVAIDRILSGHARQRRSLLALGVSDASAPMAAGEAQRVGAAWPRSTVHTGSGATASALLDEAHQHDVVHFAGHGMFRPDAPEFSAIRLADRWVTAAEVARLRLDGQLVVLSACDTGRRTSDTGVRETLGLPRAFLAAGAAGVIVNLWPADDDVTSELMTALHLALASGRADATALREAQLHAMTIRRHPYYWAAATLIGGRGGP